MSERVVVADKPTALSHVRVIDVTHFGAAPLCSRHLANLGAEVLKVEPVKGEPVRHLPPIRDGESYFFHFYNTDKKSLTVDLNQERGGELVRALAGEADVFLENYAVGAMERAGLGYERLRQLNPGLIYCSVSGFGQRGPYRAKRAYDTIIQAMVGVMSLTGWPDGLPTKTGPSTADTNGASFATIAVLAALHYRERAGRGQYVDLSMFDAFSYLTQHHWPETLLGVAAPSRQGNRDPDAMPGDVFQAQDRWVAIAAQDAVQRSALAGLVGRPDLALPPTTAEIDLLAGAVADWVAGRTAAEAAAECALVGVSAGIVATVLEAIRAPQIVAREIVVERPHRRFGALETAGSPLRMSRTPGRVERPAPELGEHNSSVLRDLLGLDNAAVADLREKGIIG
ncbi:MAG: CoA transferase [Chloroflexi bacterium]|nr:CoA transferase [Chloroflexota bacterium]